EAGVALGAAVIETWPTDDRHTLTNAGAIVATGEGGIGAAIGMALIGSDHQLTNEGSVEVEARGQELGVALGLASMGSGNVVENTGIDGVKVDSTGAIAVAAGIGVLGDDMRADNRGSVSVNAEGAQTALGLGLAAVDSGDGGTILRNYGMVT